MDRLLDDVEMRILGCLIEKSATTPEYYPLTLNSLKNACNQKSNRFPVTNYDESTIVDGIRRLQGEGLVKIASGSGQRVRKYVHKFKEKFFTSSKGMAVMCVLMLRGAQTLGEIRIRSERIYSFENLQEVEATIEELRDRDHPLVQMLPRQPGRKEHRYIQLLTGEPEMNTAEMELKEPQNIDTSPDIFKRLEKVETDVKFLLEELVQLKALINDFTQKV